MQRSGVAPLYRGPVLSLNGGRFGLEQLGQLVLDWLGCGHKHLSLYRVCSTHTS